MDNKIEEILDDFYKLYYKIEKLNIDSTIRCLTTNEMRIIDQLGYDKITINDLADRLAITIGTASTAVSRLEKKLFIFREKDKEDKRRVYIALTKKGRLAYDVHGDFNKGLFETITTGIDKKELKTFEMVLRKITSNLYTIKNDLEPISISRFLKGDVITIFDIKGDEQSIRSLIEKGLSLGKEIEIIEKTKDYIKTLVSSKVVVINKENSDNIYCIKKEVK